MFNPLQNDAKCFINTLKINSSFGMFLQCSVCILNSTEIIDRRDIQVSIWRFGTAMSSETRPFWQHKLSALWSWVTSL